MALRPLQTGLQPIGQYDALDDIVSTVKGGEVAYIGSVLLSANDKTAADGLDGYLPAGLSRAVVRTNHSDGYNRPLFLTDEGTSPFYGTLWGSVVGGTAGSVTSPSVIGPGSAAGSGKITLHGAGLYAISLDATDTSSSTGINPANSACVPGVNLKYTSTGLLTISNGVVNCPTVGNFVEFTTDGSLVTSSAGLVGTFNPPNGALAAPGATSATWAVIFFNPPASKFGAI